MPRNKRKHDFKFMNSAILNNVTFRYYLNNLIELGLSVFEWDGLPDTVDSRFLEYTLFYSNHALFFKDPDLGFLCLECTTEAPLNVYREPVKRRAYAVSNYSRDCNMNDSVLIWNNMIHTPSYPDAELYAYRLYEIERTIDVNVKGQKHPVAILATEDERLTMLNLYEKYDGNEPFIFGGKNLDLNSITTINTESPYVADKLTSLKSQYMSEYLARIGVPSSPSKRERVQSNELMASLGGVLANRYSRLTMRERAADAINKMFGLNVKVHYQKDLDKLFDDDNSKPQNAGNKNTGGAKNE